MYITNQCHFTKHNEIKQERQRDEKAHRVEVKQPSKNARIVEKKSSSNKESESKKNSLAQKCVLNYTFRTKTQIAALRKMSAFKESLVKMMRFCTLARAALRLAQWLRGQRSLFTFFRLTQTCFVFFGMRFFCFALFQFSIKLICNPNRETEHQNDGERRRDNVVQQTHHWNQQSGFLLGSICWSGTELKIGIGKRCEICFTLKVGSHNSYNAISSQPKRQTSTVVCVCVESHRLKMVSFACNGLNLSQNPLFSELPGKRMKIINISKLPKTPIVLVLVRVVFFFVLVKYFY